MLISAFYSAVTQFNGVEKIYITLVLCFDIKLILVHLLLLLLFAMGLATAIVLYKDCLFRYEEDFLFLFEEYVLVKDFCTYSVFVSREVREQEVKT